MKKLSPEIICTSYGMIKKRAQMNYESKMLEQFAMPDQREVEQILLRTLLKHGGVIKEFGSGQEIVNEMANEFGLNERQRSAFLETIYRKENRVKKSLLWHRLLFRAADALARKNLVIPTAAGIPSRLSLRPARSELPTRHRHVLRPRPARHQDFPD